MFGKKNASTVYDRAKFYAAVQGQAPAKADYDRYAGVVGKVSATYMLGMLFERCARMLGGDGKWSAGAMVNRALPVTPTMTFEVKNSDVAALLNYNATMLMGDLLKINGRNAYIVTLLQKCRAGTLQTELAAGNTEPEGNYYTAPPVPPVPPGLPALPPRTPAMINRAKALAWVTRGVHGNTNAYQQAVMTHVKPGQWPLGTDDSIVASIWNDLTRGDGMIPSWRDVNPATPYPSSIGGRYLLKNLMGMTLSGNGWPAGGDAAWQDWALFMLGALMTMQAFPDANKRVTRTCYAIVMLSGQIPFVAPTDRYGSQLAQMM